MQANLDQVYLEVAFECYRRVRTLPEGTEVAEVAEHAISLALGRQGAEQPAPMLFHDVMRNSQHSVRRSRVRHGRVVEESGQLALRGVSTGGTAGFDHSDTPECVCVVRDELEALRAAAASCGAHGERVLAGLLAGETSGETAAAAGVSRATVERIVRRLRETANGIGLRAAA